MHASNALEKEIISEAKNTIQALTEKNVQSYISACELIQQWSLDSEIRRFKYNPSIDELNERYWYIPIKEKIGSTFIFHQYLDNIFLYYPQADVVISNSLGLADSTTLYESVFKNSFPSYDQWKDYLVQGSAKNNNSIIVETGNKEKAIIVWGKANYNSYTTSEVYIILLLNAGQMLMQYRSEELKDESNYLGIYFLDSDNNVITHRGQELPLELDLDSLSDDGGIIETRNYLLLYSNPTILNCRYAIVCSKTSFWEKISKVRNLTCVLIMLYLILAAIVVFVYIKWNKKQFSEVLKTAATLGVHISPTSNEFDMIINALTTISNDKYSLEKKLIDQTNIVRKSFLMDLLYGKVNLQQLDIDEINRSYNLCLQDTQFAVLIFHINEYKTSLYSPEYSLYDNIQILHFAIINITEELLNEKFYVCSTEMENTITFIINFKASTEDEWHAVTSAVKNAVKKLDDLLSVSVVAAVSGIHNGIGNLQYAYREALKAMEYRCFTSNPVLIYGEIDMQALPETFHYSLITSQQLMNLIKAGDSNKAHALMKHIFEENYAFFTSATVEERKYFEFNIVNSLLKVSEDLSAQYGLYNNTSRIKNLLEFANYVDFFREANAIIAEICDWVKKNSKTDTIIPKKIQEYIMQNYSNPELSSTLLGDVFNLSPGYLSRLFKEATGIGIPDFINMVRIEKAKALLTESTQSAQEISTEVGYNVYHSFSRIFKKLEGVSPQKYRELYKGSK